MPRRDEGRICADCGVDLDCEDHDERCPERLQVLVDRAEDLMEMRRENLMLTGRDDTVTGFEVGMPPEEPGEA